MEAAKKLLDPEQVKRQICDNLVAAGLLLRDEVEHYKLLLGSYGEEALIAVLICSHELADEAIKEVEEILNKT